MAQEQSYDLLLRGGHVVCPASNLNGVMDVAVRGGVIAAVRPDILPSSAKEVIDVRGRLVIPGRVGARSAETRARDPYPRPARLTLRLGLWIPGSRLRCARAGPGMTTQLSIRFSNSVRGDDFAFPRA